MVEEECCGEEYVLRWHGSGDRIGSTFYEEVPSILDRRLVLAAVHFFVGLDCGRDLLRRLSLFVALSRSSVCNVDSKATLYTNFENIYRSSI